MCVRMYGDSLVGVYSSYIPIESSQVLYVQYTYTAHTVHT